MYWLRARTHPTWHFTAVCLGFLCGVAMALVYAGAGHWVWLVAGLLLAGLSLWRYRRGMVVLALVGGLLIGLFHGSLALDERQQYQPLYGQAITLQGVVVEDITESQRGASIQLRNIRYDGHDLPGVVWVRLPVAGDLRRSDELTVKGKLGEGFGSFVASMPRASLVGAHRPVPGDIALQWRDGFADSVRTAIEQPAADLGIGFLLGQKSQLPESLLAQMQIVGLTHIVVASGYNLTILVRLGRRLFEKVSKYLSVLSGGVMIAGFMAITGLSPSMTRAGLVAGLGLWAWYYGRTFHPVVLLLLAAAVTVLYNPAYIWGDVGWMLSFTAFAGVMLLAPLVTAYFYGEDRPPLLPQLLIETGSAILMTAPVIMVTFGVFSNVSILSNLLILPFIPLTMALTAIAGVAGYVVSESIAQVVGWPAEIMLKTMVAVVDWCAKLPWAQSEMTMGLAGAVITYSGIVAAMLWLRWKTKYQLRKASIIE